MYQCIVAYTINGFIFVTKNGAMIVKPAKLSYSSDLYL